MNDVSDLREATSIVVSFAEAMNDLGDPELLP